MLVFWSIGMDWWHLFSQLSCIISECLSSRTYTKCTICSLPRKSNLVTAWCRDILMSPSNMIKEVWFLIFRDGVVWMSIGQTMFCTLIISKSKFSMTHTPSVILSQLFCIGSKLLLRLWSSQYATWLCLWTSICSQCINRLDLGRRPGSIITILHLGIILLKYLWSCRLLLKESILHLAIG